MSSRWTVFLKLRSLEVIEEECFLPITITVNSTFTIGTLFHVDRSPNIDFAKFINEKVNTYVGVDQIYTYVDGERIAILDNDGFICACVMHYRGSNNNFQRLSLYINESKPQEESPITKPFSLL
ncbi:unnamed protein product [Mucor hiemalis]